MHSAYNRDLKAHVMYDEAKRVRHIRHSQEYWFSEEHIPRLTAAEYLRKIAATFQIPEEQLKKLHQPVSFNDPREQDIEYRLAEEKHFFDSTLVGYYQTFCNVPVWRKGITVKIKQNPYRVVGSTNNGEEGLKGELPDSASIKRFQLIFEHIKQSGSGSVSGRNAIKKSSSFMYKSLGMQAMGKEDSKNEKGGQRITIEPLNGRFFIYKYDQAKRFAGKPTPLRRPNKDEPHDLENGNVFFMNLPPVPDSIKKGQSYLVAEFILKVVSRDTGDMVWLALIEAESNSVLYIEPMTQGVNGMVFKRDPMVSSGDLSITADKTNDVLDDYDSDEALPDLDPPSAAGIQSLRGTYVVIQNEENPNIAPPTKPSGDDFDFLPRTNDFGAINAYYHQTWLFKTIESLGFPIATYFDGTTFPIPIDHRGMGTANANTINAHWSPNGTGGTDHLCFALCDTSDIANPLGRAVDPWVHWHEMGGHGTLGDHVGSGNLGFAHSAGDGLAALQMDPESALRSLPERFKYAPFRPIPAGSYERRFDRDVAIWAWGSSVVYDASGVLVSGDNGGYGSEQILATCHFRIYRAIGGDHGNLGRRQFASRMMTYLILRTISNLTSATNPDSPEAWCEEMMETDLENWTSEGLSGGAYNKVIRWAFEKQGAFQPAGAPTPVTTPGAPPEVDVYIDDGRHGEYEFKANHWENVSMWNRNISDGIESHQDAAPGVTNYMYVKVKNRGTATASGITVRGFHCLPGAGLTWPVDFTEMNPAGGLAVASIAANNAEEVTVGPFEWIPNENVYGHDCVLMIASCDGDPSNIDNFTLGETIEEWRLVPNDNNIGQRNISILPGESGEKGLMESLNKRLFFARNPFKRRVVMELKAELPKMLAAAGWRLKFEGIEANRFVMKPGEKRQIVIECVPGRDFTAGQIRNSLERDITVSLYGNGMLLGGMTYRIDPDKKRTVPSMDKEGRCVDKATDLLRCLKVGDRKAKKVRVRKVTLDIDLEGCCD